MPVHPAVSSKFPLLEGVAAFQVKTMLHGFLDLPATIAPVSAALDLIVGTVSEPVR